MKNPTPEYRKEVLGSLLALYSMQDPDEKAVRGTFRENYAGFNGGDSGPMSKYSERVLNGEELSDRDLFYIHKTLIKYTNQLDGLGHTLPPYVDESQGLERIIGDYKGSLAISFNYAKGGPEIISGIKGSNFFKRYDPQLKQWIVLGKDKIQMEEVSKFANQYKFIFTPEAKKIVDDIMSKTAVAVTTTPEIKPESLVVKTIDFKNNEFVFSFKHPNKNEFFNLLAAVKDIPGRTYNGIDKVWTLSKKEKENIMGISKLANDYGFTFTPEAKDAFSKYAMKLVASGSLTDRPKTTDVAISREKMFELSSALDADITIPGLKRQLKPHQKAAVKYALIAKRTFMGDEPGLGKSFQALAAVHVAGAYPSLIVCPNTLKYNWGDEISQDLDKDYSVLDDKGKVDFNASVVIINYDAMKKFKDELKAKKFKSVIFDESQYLKNRKAIRSTIAAEIAKGVEYVFELSGTIAKNRPLEVTNQLEVMDRLKDFGGFFNFANRYCDPKPAYGGHMDFTGASNLEELNKKLRECCYIRHEKKDVLKDLPNKERIKVFLEITNRAEYNKAERNLIEYIRNMPVTNKEFLESIQGLPKEEQDKLKSEFGDIKAAKASRAEQLARIELTKQIAVKGKMEAFKEWVVDFLETGEKLLIFANHIDVIDDLARTFDAPKIYGDTKTEERQKIVKRFQTDPNCNLVILNTRTGGVGITMTAAFTVAFIEQDWSPSDHIQAEDRVHRMGQKNAVTAYYFLGKDTIDEEIHDLILSKMKVVDLVNKGKPVNEVDEENREKEQKGIFTEFKELMSNKNRNRHINPLIKPEVKKDDGLGKALFMGASALLIFFWIKRINEGKV